VGTGKGNTTAQEAVPEARQRRKANSSKAQGKKKTQEKLKHACRETIWGTKFYNLHEPKEFSGPT
jgi:hypothetical protein